MDENHRNSWRTQPSRLVSNKIKIMFSLKFWFFSVHIPSASFQAYLYNFSCLFWTCTFLPVCTYMIECLMRAVEHAHAVASVNRCGRHVEPTYVTSNHLQKKRTTTLWSGVVLANLCFHIATFVRKICMFRSWLQTFMMHDKYSWFTFLVRFLCVSIPTFIYFVEWFCTRIISMYASNILIQR